MWHLIRLPSESRTIARCLLCYKSWTARMLPFYLLNLDPSCCGTSAPFLSWSCLCKWVCPSPSFWLCLRPNSHHTEMLLYKRAWPWWSLFPPTICTYILYICSTWLCSVGSIPLKFHINGIFGPSKIQMGRFLLTVWILSVLFVPGISPHWTSVDSGGPETFLYLPQGQISTIASLYLGSSHLGPRIPWDHVS